MYKDILKAVKWCSACALSKSAPTDRQGMFAATLPIGPMEKLYLYFINPAPWFRSGNTYALVVVDAFSKFCWIYPPRIINAGQTIHILNQVTFSAFGLSRVLVSDNGPQFLSHIFRSFCFSHGIRLVTMTPYMPKANQPNALIAN